MTLYITPEWIKKMHENVEASTQSIYISALSMQAPAHKSITPHSKYMRAIAAACARGVRVCVWLAKPRPDIPATHANTGARQWLMAQGIECRFCDDGKLLHAKTMVIDGLLLWIGSGNMTAAAAHHNHEAYLCVSDTSAARRWLDKLHSLKTC